MTLAVGAMIGYAPGAFAQDVPLEFTESGDAVPGGTMMVTVATTDGSTIQSVAWSQAYGAAASLSGADTATVSVTFATQGEYKDFLFDVLAESPIPGDGEGEEFHGGQQNRWEVVGMSPFAVEEAGLVELHVMVTTDSGSYETDYDIDTTLGWTATSGVSNVPIGVPVLLHGKEQAAYDWSMTGPGGSTATLMDATSQYPEFTPDVTGRYTVTATDEATSEEVTLTIWAGTWRGIIDGEDANGNPTVDGCDDCHFDTVADWAQTGHAEIFKNSLNTNDHYSANCFACHTVGYNLNADNNGIDEAPDYQAFLDSGLLGAGDPNAYATVLATYPETAKLSNIQCENCHGPQNGGAHTQGVRGGISSSTCGVCHGEPPRHGRFQQWQVSPHANYELAVEEGQSGTCSKCHTGNGFLAWLPINLGLEPGDVNDSVEVTWTEDETHPQTCVTCHDPHNIGDASGDDNNATVWISGDTPELLAGYIAEDVGRGAICMTCHNHRRGLRNDSTWDDTEDKDRAPHLGTQTDVLMGQSVYFMEVGDRSYHSMLEDSCADCHMEETPPPPGYSNYPGANHTFYASKDICASCHSVITAEDVQGPTEMMLTEIHHQLVEAWEGVVDDVLAGGNTIDLDGDATIESASDITAIEYSETRGRQALIFTLSDGMEYGPYGVGSIDVVPAEGDPYALYTVAPGDLLKAGWNFLLFEADGSLGVHNPSFAEDVLEVTEETLGEIISGGGMPGGGANAVSCTSDYVYWTEIAARLPGTAGAVWRTDFVAKNNGSAMANIHFYLHADAGMFDAAGTIDAGAQGVFEDVVDIIGADGNKGALEICSDQPLEAVARIYNVSDDGTFGQFLDGISYSGLDAGDTGRLYALRQMTGEFRTNISVTNTGMTAATVEITLYGTNASELTSYELTVASGMAVQDLEPFRTRANSPDLGWGYASVEVTSGDGVITSASVIDSRTNDATTIPMKY